jgi:hypothetical protein
VTAFDVRVYLIFSYIKFFRAGLEQLYEGMLLAALSQQDTAKVKVRTSTQENHVDSLEKKV